MKIENKAIDVSRRGRDDGEFSEFLEAVPRLKVGQSIIVKHNPSNYRLAMSIARAWLKIELASQKEVDGVRIARVR